MKKTAILVDGVYFFKAVGNTYNEEFKKYVNTKNRQRTEDLAILKATILLEGCQKILRKCGGELSEIYFCDALRNQEEAFMQQPKNPINQNDVHIANYILGHTHFIQFLHHHEPRFSYKSGFTANYPIWVLENEAVKRLDKFSKDLLNPKKKTSTQAGKETKNEAVLGAVIGADAIRLELKEKTVDMLIGMKIARLCIDRLKNRLKKGGTGSVDQIVLVAGDADYIPTAFLAADSGIDFYLDPMPLKTDAPNSLKEKHPKRSRKWEGLFKTETDPINPDKVVNDLFDKDPIWSPTIFHDALHKYKKPKNRKIPSSPQDRIERLKKILLEEQAAARSIEFDPLTVFDHGWSHYEFLDWLALKDFTYEEFCCASDDPEPNPDPDPEYEKWWQQCVEDYYTSDDPEIVKIRNMKIPNDNQN